MFARCCLLVVTTRSLGVRCAHRAPRPSLGPLAPAADGGAHHLRICSHSCACVTFRMPGRHKGMVAITAVRRDRRLNDRRFHPAVHPGVAKIDYETQIESRELPGPVGAGRRGRSRQGTLPCRVQSRPGCLWTQTDRLALLLTVGSYGPRFVALRALGLSLACVRRDTHGCRHGERSHV